MKRRALLRSVALAGTAGLAGCTGDAPGDGGGSSPTPTPTPTDTGTPTPLLDTATRTDSPTEPTASPTASETPSDTPTATDTPTPTTGGGDVRVTDRSFEVVDQGCGQGTNEASVARPEPDVVAVTGTISGRNGCYTAELDGATYDGERDRLTVAVRAYDASPDEMCTQCLVDIDYESRIVLSGGTPGEVVVTHNGERVAG